MWSTEQYMILILLIGQLAQCILSSRCTKISSPCFTIERDVIPSEEVVSRMNRTRSNSDAAASHRPQLLEAMVEPRKPLEDENV